MPSKIYFYLETYCYLYFRVKPLWQLLDIRLFEICIEPRTSGSNPKSLTAYIQAANIIVKTLGSIFSGCSIKISWVPLTVLPKSTKVSIKNNIGVHDTMFNYVTKLLNYTDRKFILQNKTINCKKWCLMTSMHIQHMYEYITWFYI